MNSPFYLPIVDAGAEQIYAPSNGGSTTFTGGPTPVPMIPFVPTELDDVLQNPPIIVGAGGTVPQTSGEVLGSVQGASSPDLLVVPQRGGGGGLNVGTLALLALLVVGGWWLYKKAREA